MKIIATTSDKALPQLIQEAKDLAQVLAVPYVPRNKLSLESIREVHKAEQILVVTKKNIQLVMSQGVYFFHIGMAKLRIKSLCEGKYDHMASAMDLAPGYRVLDCTLGLGTDAIVASYLTGATGHVTGLEASAVVAEIVRRGLRSYEEADQEIVQAMRRIEVIAGDYLQYLKSMPAKSFDVVYFDPMFRRPVKESSGIAPLRMLANHAPVSSTAITEAIRVAKKKVVFKEAVYSHEFARLGFQHFCGGKYSSVMYGYIDPEEGE
ncbi:MAG TPA: class I SAM-dependent methyltransferase [Negativicutes bacterium]|nr:class I SAM-dependent methyltransferase [Negativicutes bacterium]